MPKENIKKLVHGALQGTVVGVLLWAVGSAVASFVVGVPEGIAYAFGTIGFTAAIADKYLDD